MTNLQKYRRRFLKFAGLLGVGSGVSVNIASAMSGSRDKFAYEVVRSDAEWRSMFDDETYKILRLGDTEWPKSSKW
jgi:hypothetical protein